MVDMMRGAATFQLWNLPATLTTRLGLENMPIGSAQKSANEINEF